MQDSARTVPPSEGEGVAVPTPSARPAEMHDLTPEELQSSLSDIGHNPYGELVYTRSHLASKHLCALPGLQRYVYLQRLCVDDNGLSELDAVRYMPQLVHLHARHNRLSSGVFTSLAEAAAGSLEQLYLDGNCITSLDGLEKLPFLLDLRCGGNQVRHLPARCLAAAQRLMSLSLSDNALEAIDTDAFAAAPLLRTLDLSDNFLSSTDFLSSVTPQIEKVNLSGNRVCHLSAAVEQLSCLTVLDVGRNELSGLKELRVLRGLQALRALVFEGNTALECFSYDVAEGGGRLSAPLSTAAHGSEYHQEVVMSDDGEESGALLSTGGGAVEAAAATSTAAVTTDAAIEGNKGPNQSSILCPSSIATSELDRNEAGVASISRRCANSIPGWKSSGSLATRAAIPTTADYVGLAAPETHGFVRSVGSVRRDAALDVRVHHQKEVLALPQREQVHLWTLSVLPQLTEMNGRAIGPDEVAKAAFLFRADVLTHKQEA
ncbi:hypothetical protein LSCM1_00158 [Leishmania martiniquensis]|uniref:Leucine-rich repeat protein n=1 Tax=Leishmania martiniquensis TaxID=1580590 RepID=A0A836GBG3_9TRYP|nr:hypothetical protein LSCM1_00158 [Leishmania martiniquensis]